MVVAAAVAWLLILALIRRTRHLEAGDASLTFLIAICGALIGAFMLRPVMKMVEVIIYWDQLRMVPSGELLSYVFGEIVFYGGLLGAITAIVLFCRKYDISIVRVFDLFAPAVALGHAIGRVGCFFGGCCYGIAVSQNHPLSVVYPHTSLAAPSGVPLLALPLIESVFLLALSVALTVLYLKNKIPGYCAAVYFLSYSIGRFILEYFRGDIIRGRYGPFTTSQYISIAVLVFCICYYLVANRLRGEKRHTKKEEC